MKKILAILVGVTMALSAFASPITPEQALRRVASSAQAVKSLDGKSGAPTLVMTGETSVGVPAYYVFTNSGGTLFLSADDEVTPLLGYTSAGAFDPSDMSPSLKWWLDQYAREIAWLNKSETTGSAVTQFNPVPMRLSKKTDDRPAIAPLIKTTWSQGAPFNELCPMYNGERSVTGCMATAVAQTLNYYKWPEEAVPSISYQWILTGETLTSPSVTIDWDNMLDSYADGYTREQANAVARLMQVAGYSVKMNYSNESSGAYSSDLRSALVDVFGYDIATDYLRRDFYTADEWDEIIYNNLKDLGPVLYDGYGDQGGHSFVCDGYDGNGYFHMNWGWGGLSDGYFILSALNPEALGTGGGSGGFNYGQGAIIGLQRPKAGSQAPAPYIGSSDILTGYIYDRYIVYETENNNDGFWNYGSVEGRFSLGVKLENVTTGAVSYYSSEDFVNIDLAVSYGFHRFGTEIPTTVENGTYKAYPVYKVNSGDWENVKLIEESPKYLLVKADDSGLSIVDPDEGSLTLESWDCPTGFVSEEAYQFFLTISNTYPIERSMTLTSYLTKIEDGRYMIYADLGTSTLTIPAASQADMEFSGTLDILEAGDYYLIFVEDGSAIGRVSVTVSSKGIISVESMTLDPETLLIGQTSNVSAVVNNSYSEAKDVDLSLYLCIYDDGYNVAHKYGNATASIEANGSATVDFTTVIPDGLPAGDYYLVIAHTETGKIIKAMEVTVAEGETGEITVTSFTADPEVLIIGQTSDVEVEVSSSYTTEQTLDLRMYLCYVDGEQLIPSVFYGTKNVTIPAGGTATLNFSTVISEEITPGYYYLVLTYDTGKIIDYLEVSVEEAPEVEEGEITASSITSDPKDIIIGETSNVSAVVNSTFSTDKTIDATMYLCYESNDRLYISVNYGNQEATIPANGSVTLDFSTKIPEDITPGQYYLVLTHTETRDIIEMVEVEVITSQTAIDTVDFEGESTGVRYFNMQGIEFDAENLSPGFYIRRSNDKVEKILVK